jgi:hypothetical protein
VTPAKDLFEALQKLSAQSVGGSEQATRETIELASRLLTLGEVPYLWSTRGYSLMLQFVRHGSLEDLTGAVVDFKRAVAATPPGDVEVYRRVLNMAWASEARYDVVGAQGKPFMVIQVDGVERWRGPRDLVHPISALERLLATDTELPPGSPDLITKIKRNLANLLSRYALDVDVRPKDERVRDMRRAVELLEQALGEATPGSADHRTIANSLVATVEQGRAAGLLAGTS